jgi:hypothetical protein
MELNGTLASAGSCEHGKEPSGSIEKRISWTAELLGTAVGWS